MTDAFSFSWAPFFSYGFPPFCLLNKLSAKIRSDSAMGIFILPVWPTQPWFPVMLHLLAANPVMLMQSENLLFLPFSDKKHHLLPQMRLMTCLLSGCRLETEESSTNSQKYHCFLGRLFQETVFGIDPTWGRFCVIRKIHPCRASVLDGLNFLQYLFNLNVSYSSINTARSALSFILPRNDCGSFGQHFLVKKFVRGVYNLRTPAPKYSYIWDVSVVLKFFRHLPENNLLSLKLLSLKLVMLVALVSGQRVQTLSLLDLSFTYSVYDSIVFVIPDMTKTSRPGKSASQIVLSEYGQDKRLCVVLLDSIPIENS